MIYLDPHYTRPTLELKALDQFSEQDFQSYHCEEVKKVHISKIDPSLLLGFYCETKEDLQRFLMEVQVAKEGKTSIFSVDEAAPVYSDVDDLDDLDDF